MNTVYSNIIFFFLILYIFKRSSGKKSASGPNVRYKKMRLFSVLYHACWSGIHLFSQKMKKGLIFL